MKKGFTLIELLAVIVLLAIIALIATPVLLNIINDTRANANKRSIDMYAKAVENAIALYQTNGKNVVGDFVTDDGKILINTSDSNIKLNVEYDGNVVCDVIKISKEKKLTLHSCKVNGKKVNYIYGDVSLGERIILNHGGYDSIKDLKGKKKLITTNEYLGESATLYFSNNIEIDNEKGVLKLVGNVQQKTIYYDNIEYCGYDNSCDHGTYGAPSLESSYVYENFGTQYGTLVKNLTASKKHFGYEYNSKAGTGLYKTEDSLGTSYYFRGDIKNNYVKFRVKETIHHDAMNEQPYVPVDIADSAIVCGENEDCLFYYDVYTKFVFASKEDCESTGENIAWTTCEKLNVNEVYSPVEEPDLAFKTKQDCIDIITKLNTEDGEFTTCESRKLRNYDAYDEVVYKNHSYWRIVRINSDGTIRLIYDGNKPVENGKSRETSISGSLDTWYQNNITNYSFDKYVAQTNFINDTGFSVDTFADSNIYGIISDWHYTGYNSKNPSLKTGTSESKKIGLLTATEAALAGSLGTISNNYLSGSSFITTTKSHGTSYITSWEECTFSSSHGCHIYETLTGIKTDNYYYIVANDGSLSTSTTGATRPVINLKADVPYKGSGTIKDPYVIEYKIKD